MLGFLGVIAVLAVLAGPAQAVKPDPSGKQAGKFVVLGTGEVLDTTTSLRWQRDPGRLGDAVSNCNNGNACLWQEAVDYCATLGSDARLPEIKELVSLVDYGQVNPALPLGHPFSNVQSEQYWSATSHADTPTEAWHVFFLSGGVGTFDKDNFPFVGRAWCAL